MKVAILGALDCYRDHIYFFGDILEAWSQQAFSDAEALHEILVRMGMRFMAGEDPLRA